MQLVLDADRELAGFASSDSDVRSFRKLRNVRGIGKHDRHTTVASVKSGLSLGTLFGACFHGSRETLEQVIAVHWAGACFGVVLHGINWPVRHANPAI